MTNALLDIFGRTMRWIVRFRKRRGYGVHSPFAFGMITGVVYEKGCYYAYEDIKKIYHKEHPKASPWRWKDYKFLFRLANFQHPQEALIVDKRGDKVLREALTKGCQHCNFYLVDCGNLPSNKKYDFIMVTEGWECQAPVLLSLLREGGMLVVKGLARRQRTAWNALLKQSEAQVTFDLYDFGILFNRPTLQRQRYVVNYW